MPVIADGITLSDVTTHEYCVFGIDGSNETKDFTYTLDSWGESRRGITIISTDNLMLKAGKKYRVSIEETDGR